MITDNCTPVSVDCTAALASLEHTVTITVNPVNDAPGSPPTAPASLDEDAAREKIHDGPAAPLVSDEVEDNTAGMRTWSTAIVAGPDTRPRAR